MDDDEIGLLNPRAAPKYRTNASPISTPPTSSEDGRAGDKERASMSYTGTGVVVFEDVGVGSLTSGSSFQPCGARPRTPYQMAPGPVGLPGLCGWR